MGHHLATLITQGYMYGCKKVATSTNTRKTEQRTDCLLGDSCLHNKERRPLHCTAPRRRSTSFCADPLNCVTCVCCLSLNSPKFHKATKTSSVQPTNQEFNKCDNTPYQVCNKVIRSGACVSKQLKHIVKHLNVFSSQPIRHWTIMATFERPRGCV